MMLTAGTQFFESQVLFIKTLLVVGFPGTFDAVNSLLTK